jgi:hypothetical protein
MSAAGVAWQYGTQLYYIDNANTNLGTLVRTPTSGGVLTAIATNVYYVAPGSPPEAYNPHFQETSAGLYVSWCANPVSASCTLARFDANGASTPIATNIDTEWGADSAGDRVFVRRANGRDEVLDANGTSVVTLEANVTSGMLSPSGTEIVYAVGGALKVLTIANPTPSTILPSGAAEIVAVPDDGHAFYSSVLGVPPAWGDLSGVPLVASAQPTVLNHGPSRFLAFDPTRGGMVWSQITNPQMPKAPSDIYWTLFGLPPTQLAASSLFQRVPKNGLLVFNRNITDLSMPIGDIALVDASAMPVVLASAANGAFALSPDRGTLYYGTDSASPAGIYAVVMP